jgi:hypothetical protein
MSNVTHTHSDKTAQVVDTPVGTRVDESGSEPTVAVPSGWFSNGVSTGGRWSGPPARTSVPPCVSRAPPSAQARRGSAEPGGPCSPPEWCDDDAAAWTAVTTAGPAAPRRARRRWCRRADRSTAEDREATRALAGLLGPPGVVELITVVGYYRLLAQLMEAFLIEPPDDTTTPGR